MSKKICPFCGGEQCIERIGETSGKLYSCSTYNWTIELHKSILDSPYREKLLCLITEILLNKERLNLDEQQNNYVFYCSDKNWESSLQCVNAYNLINTFPRDFIDKAIRSLVNISRICPEYGSVFRMSPKYYRAVFDEKQPTENFCGMCNLLVELGYLAHQIGPMKYSITAQGWKKIEEMKKRQVEVKQGFIAMSFSDETRIIREAFKNAIKESGYAFQIIDEKEHNNQIVPEIFYEIKRSKFVVMDVTVPNYGAYYEAGYAQALGKQVIICCRKKEFDSSNTRPHFDVAQKSMVVWESEADLVEKLKKRIEVTVH